LILVAKAFAVALVEPRVAEVYNDGLSETNLRLFNRTKRTGGELFHSLVGMWLPVYIPQAETAYNYKDPVYKEPSYKDELPKYNPPPKKHQDVSQIPTSIIVHQEY